MSTRILVLKDGVITPAKTPTDTTNIINSLGVVDLVNNQTLGGIKTFSGGFALPTTIGTTIGTVWRNVDTLEYKDSANVTKILLNSAGNLSNLSNRQTSLNNLIGTQTANRLLRSDGTNITLSQVSLTTDVINILPVTLGGTGQTTLQSTINSLSGGVTSGTYLRGNGTNVLLSAIPAGDIPTLNQNTTGTASNITGVLSLLNGGTGATTQQTAINALVGTQTASRVLRSNGTNMLLAQVGLTTDVIGTLSIANGGTNSSTQNFIDLTTTQTAAGEKSFSNIFRVTNITESTSTTTGASIISGGQGITGNQSIGGFTSLGDNIAIKKKYITGTSAAAQGDSAMIPHGITTSKFRGITVLIEYTLNSFMPQMFIAQAGYCFGFYIQGSNVIIQNVNVSGFSSIGILSKPIHIVIEYIA